MFGRLRLNKVIAEIRLVAMPQVMAQKTGSGRMSDVAELAELLRPSGLRWLVHISARCEL